MPSRSQLTRILVLAALPLAGLLALMGSEASEAQRPINLPAVSAAAEARDLRRALQAARVAAARANARSQRLSAQAASATTAQGRAQLELTRLAARLQEAEAQASVAEARLALLQQQRRIIDRDLAARREPLVQLTAALQRLTTRPLALSALQPSSLRDAVYLRVVLGHAVPAIQDRTAALRAELERSRQLAGQARLVLRALRQAEAALASRRTELLAQSARNRQAFAVASRAAEREARRSEDMALEARDLDELVGRFDRMAQRRAELAALPGPVMRPGTGDDSGGANPASGAAAAAPVASAPSAPADYRLPVVGRIAGGFGDAAPGGLVRSGLTLEPRPEALVVSPAAGRIAFAGPYRGFGMIVIIEHGGGWTSLVTGLGALQAEVGQRIGAGAPLGTAPGRRPAITLELRQEGEPVDPLPFALRNSG